MKHSKLVLVLLLVFGAGYGVGAKLGLGPSSPVLPVDCVAAKGETRANAEAPMGARVDSKPVVSAVPVAVAGKTSSAKAGVATRPVDGKTSSVRDSDAEQPAQNIPENSQNDPQITDEEIERVLPPPYSRLLKGNPLRNRYKPFALATSQENRDIARQEHINEHIFRSQYANFIELVGLKCAADVCEIRLYESKAGVWGVILSEMAMQPWWEQPLRSIMENGPETGRKERQFIYTLFAFF